MKVNSLSSQKRSLPKSSLMYQNQKPTVSVQVTVFLGISENKEKVNWKPFEEVNPHLLILKEHPSKLDSFRAFVRETLETAAGGRVAHAR